VTPARHAGASVTAHVVLEPLRAAVLNVVRWTGAPSCQRAVDCDLFRLDSNKTHLVSQIAFCVVTRSIPALTGGRPAALRIAFDAETQGCESSGHRRSVETEGA
jgi:hypothetical protein